MLKLAMTLLIFWISGPAMADVVPSPSVRAENLKDENLAYLFAFMPEKSLKEIGMLGDKRVLRKIHREPRRLSGKSNQLISDQALVCYKEEIYPAQKFKYDTRYFCHQLSTQNAELPADDLALLKLIDTKRAQR